MSDQRRSLDRCSHRWKHRLMSSRSVPSRHRVLAALVVALVLVALGVVIGLRSPWGVQHPKVAEGVAIRANDENGLGLFDGGDDDLQLAFNVDDIRWEADDGTAGEGGPPCLESPLKKADVEVGYMRVSGPGDGWVEQVVWLRCV